MLIMIKARPTGEIILEFPCYGTTWYIMYYEVLDKNKLGRIFKICLSFFLEIVSLFTIPNLVEIISLSPYSLDEFYFSDKPT